MAKSIPYSERKFDKKKRNEYDMAYKKANFDRVAFVVPKGYKDIIKEAAAKEGLTMSEWIKSIIDDKINA